jgi:hypothetical protein
VEEFFKMESAIKKRALILHKFAVKPLVLLCGDGDEETTLRKSRYIDGVAKG